MHADVNDWGVRLSALAEFEAPPDGWQAVLAARTARVARVDRRWPLGLAAVAMVATAGLAVWLQSEQPGPVAGEQSPPAATGIGGIQAENERLERILAHLPERRALRGSTAFTVAELEDRLVVLDDQLSRVVLEPNAPERAERLWRERVDVLHSLVQVRFADVVGSY